jgi:hypothetical protein
MAVTLSNVKRVLDNNAFRIVGTCTGPASYTTGGELLTATQIKQLTNGASSTSLASVAVFDSEVESANFRSLVLDRTNLKVMFVAGATQVTNATDIHLVAINFELVLTPVNG